TVRLGLKTARTGAATSPCTPSNAPRPHTATWGSALMVKSVCSRARAMHRVTSCFEVARADPTFQRHMLAKWRNVSWHSVERRVYLSIAVIITAAKIMALSRLSLELLWRGWESLTRMYLGS